MPDEAQKWLEEHDKWQRNEEINSEMMPVVYVKNFIAYPASQHLERLLAANERLQEEFDKQMTVNVILVGENQRLKENQ
jgi:hypothetical protein